MALVSLVARAIKVRPVDLHDVIFFFGAANSISVVFRGSFFVCRSRLIVLLDAPSHQKPNPLSLSLSLSVELSLSLVSLFYCSCRDFLGDCDRSLRFASISNRRRRRGRLCIPLRLRSRPIGRRRPRNRIESAIEKKKKPPNSVSRNNSGNQR